ncbi:zinc finger CCCH domain-containing protein 3 isoform X2 [Canis lupus familiaris]|uniref:zinc finger CCCH domain-containing protein 3 isoform X2 n=1 Tax=Canis lupus familiaris TaxID=9615 RepID=UPI0018F4C492|nr:zinc finger CCCH domain-containing protein 3 isoform X2 [Canis lupus familiaris]
MTWRGPGRASRTPEMEEKEQLRRQIRLLQGLIDDYKNLHGNASAPGTAAASGWQPPAYNSSRSFSACYPRPSRRGFPLNHGPAWRKKYSLVNRPPGSSDPPGDCAVQPPLRAEGSQGPDPQQYVLERQVQLSSDQNMVIKIKPPSKPGSASTAGVPRGSLEEYENPPWSDHRPQEGAGEPPGGQRQPSKPGRVKGSCSAEDPLLVCQKEPGKPRVVKSVSSMSDSPSEPRRTVSESAVAVKARLVSSGLPQRSGMAVGRKVASHSVASCVAQLFGDRRVNAGHPDQPASCGLVAGPARPASGPRQARESSLLASCRTTKFRKNNYKWVAASAKSPRATRRALSPRAASENMCKAPFGTEEQVEKPQLRADPNAKPRRAAVSSTPGASPSKYKWKASSPSVSSSSSFRWQSEAGSKDHASQLSPVPSRSPPGDRPAVGSSSLKPLFSETPLSAYKVKSRTKIVRRRGGASLPGEKKSSPPPAATAKTQFSLRRRQVLRAKSSPVLKKTPSKGLMQVTRHRLCCLPPGRAHLPTKEASSLHTLRTPPTSKVIKTRYRIVKKTPVSPLNAPQFPLALPSWRARRLSLSRSLVLNRLRPAAAGGKAQPGSPRWRNRGYRCIGGVLYKVSANKLSKTYSRPSGDGSRPLLRTGRLDPTTSCSRSLASRAVQRSLAIVRQARQRRRKQRQEYCMYYNRFGRCNHGEHCPYIHDPDKVAVCTRFLRGTCKKTDGTCPFSHHVSKEKMPVCSYFLKGICSNSNCPYSHVYVSRKAEVCTDFLKGYCPLGAKCKKKHTLLCPDFSRRGTCPRGAQCQLLHRNQKRLGRRAASAPASEPGSAPPRNKASSSHGPSPRRAQEASPGPGPPGAPQPGTQGRLCTSSPVCEGPGGQPVPTSAPRSWRQGGSACHCPRGGAACHRVPPPGAPGLLLCPPGSQSSVTSVGPGLAVSVGPLCPASPLPTAHPGSSAPHPPHNPASRQACAHCGCSSSCATYPTFPQDSCQAPWWVFYVQQ